MTLLDILHDVIEYDLSERDGTNLNYELPTLEKKWCKWGQLEYRFASKATGGPIGRIRTLPSIRGAKIKQIPIIRPKYHLRNYHDNVNTCFVANGREVHQELRYMNKLIDLIHPNETPSLLKMCNVVNEHGTADIGAIRQYLPDKYQSLPQEVFHTALSVGLELYEAVNGQHPRTKHDQVLPPEQKYSIDVTVKLYGPGPTIITMGTEHLEIGVVTSTPKDYTTSSGLDLAYPIHLGLFDNTFYVNGTHLEKWWTERLNEMHTCRLATGIKWSLSPCFGNHELLTLNTPRLVKDMPKPDDIVDFEFQGKNVNGVTQNALARSQTNITARRRRLHLATNSSKGYSDELIAIADKISNSRFCSLAVCADALQQTINELSQKVSAYKRTKNKPPHMQAKGYWHSLAKGILQTKFNKIYYTPDPDTLKWVVRQAKWVSVREDKENDILTQYINTTTKRENTTLK